MAFNLGKPILVMIVLSGVAGLTSVITRKGDDRATLEHWCFSEQNWKTHTGVGLPPGQPSLQQQFERETGVDTAIKLVQYRALNTRLSNLFMSSTRWPELPDLVDVEIGTVGRYFRPPVEEVGFRPLNDFIERGGWDKKLVATRLAPWSKDGLIFGIPMDVHPTMLVYDDVLFREAGVDLASSQTWEQFIENGLKFQAYWRQKNPNLRRWTFEMTESNATTLIMMLLQRGVNLEDQHEQLHLADEVVLDTLVLYCRMLTGPRRIAASTAEGAAAYSQDLGTGYVCAMLCPDWRIRYLKDNAPSHLSGRLRAMPLPAWPGSEYRTTTWGGSMVAIPRLARDAEASWRLLEKLYLSPEAVQMRSGSTYIIPPVKAAWANPAYDTPDPYFSGQPIKRLLADLAEGVPPRYVTPASTAAEVELSAVLIEALAYADDMAADGSDDAAFREHCRELLNRAADRVRRQIAHGSFEK